MPATLDSLADVRTVMDRALESDRGIAISFDDHRALVNLRQRAYRLRKLERDLATQTFPIGHPGRGRTAYDRLYLRDKSVQNAEGVYTTITLEIRPTDEEVPPGVTGLNYL